MWKVSSVETFHTVVVAPLKNDHILSGRSIRSFRHLELKNLSIISDFRHRSRMVQEFWNCCMQEFWRRRSRSSSRSRRRRSTVLLEDVIVTSNEKQINPASSHFQMFVPDMVVFMQLNKILCHHLLHNVLYNFMPNF